MCLSKTLRHNSDGNLETTSDDQSGGAFIASAQLFSYYLLSVLPTLNLNAWREPYIVSPRTEKPFYFRLI